MYCHTVQKGCPGMASMSSIACNKGCRVGLIPLQCVCALPHAWYNGSVPTPGRPGVIHTAAERTRLLTSEHAAYDAWPCRTMQHSSASKVVQSYCIFACRFDSAYFNDPSIFGNITASLNGYHHPGYRTAPVVSRNI